jgi:cytochrome c553
VTGRGWEPNTRTGRGLPVVPRFAACAGLPPSERERGGARPGWSAMRSRLLSAVAMLCAVVPASAQDGGSAPDAPAWPATGRDAAPVPPSPAWPERGLTLEGLDAAQTAGVVCGVCHGPLGRGEGVYPPLAGQDPLYLAKQLHDYASGARPNPVMSPIASALPPRERAAAASHYAAIPPGGAAPAAAGDRDPDLLARGAELAAEGDWSRGVPPCASCHAPSALDRPPGSPVLGGMPAAYAEGQLRLWAAGERRNDLMGRMRMIASALTERDIRAVAAYYAARPPEAAR